MNSARTEIIYNEKWLRFESDLADLILGRLKETVSSDYWATLIEIWTDSSASEIFLERLNSMK